MLHKVFNTGKIIMGDLHSKSGPNGYSEDRASL